MTNADWMGLIVLLVLFTGIYIWNYNSLKENDND
jgi:hypothetical protein